MVPVLEVVDMVAEEDNLVNQVVAEEDRVVQEEEGISQEVVASIDLAEATSFSLEVAVSTSVVDFEWWLAFE